jgi:Family of unknown function (DUF6074)
MSPAVFPFPIAKRRALIDRQGRYAAALSSNAAEGHIERQLKIQGDSMRRKGIEEALVRCELKSMEAAIRAALWRAKTSSPRRGP